MQSRRIVAGFMVAAVVGLAGGCGESSAPTDTAQSPPTENTSRPTAPRPKLRVEYYEISKK